MFKIITKKMLGPKVFLMEIEAPLVAKKAMPVSFELHEHPQYSIERCLCKRARTLRLVHHLRFHKLRRSEISLQQHLYDIEGKLF